MSSLCTVQKLEQIIQLETIQTFPASIVLFMVGRFVKLIVAPERSSFRSTETVLDTVLIAMTWQRAELHHLRPIEGALLDLQELFSHPNSPLEASYLSKAEACPSSSNYLAKASRTLRRQPRPHGQGNNSNSSRDQRHHVSPLTASAHKSIESVDGACSAIQQHTRQSAGSASPANRYWTVDEMRANGQQAGRTMARSKTEYVVGYIPPQVNPNWQSHWRKLGYQGFNQVSHRPDREDTLRE